MLAWLLVLAQDPAPAPPSPPSLRIGGRLQSDFGWLGGDGAAAAAASAGSERGGSAEFRRARLRADLTLAERLQARVEFDFAAGRSQPRELALLYADAPGAAWKLGYAKLPFGFERQMSSNDFPLPEESLGEQAVPPGRGSALIRARWSDAWTVSGAVYQVTDADARAVDGGWGLAARGVWRPLHDAARGRWLHLGADLGWEDPSGATGFDALPEHHLPGAWLDTGAFASGGFLRAGLEAAAIAGPFHGLAQSFLAAPDRASGGGDAEVRGWSVLLGGTLTGESRGYLTDKACFGGVRPAADFSAGGAGGAGAWEWAARFSRLDLDAAAAPGAAAQIDVWSCGLTWHWTPHLRWMLAGSRAELADLEPAWIVTLRCGFDW